MGVLAAVPEHLGHDRQEGGPQRPPLAPDLAAAHRVAARAREARARALEGGGRTAAAAALAARALHEGAARCSEVRCFQKALSLACPPALPFPVRELAASPSEKPKPLGCLGM